MEFFKSDFFSNSKPIFSIASPEIKALVTATVATFYPQIGKISNSIYQNGGLEINSNNFLFYVGDCGYVLKRGKFKSEYDLTNVRTQVELAGWLLKQGSEFPEIIFSENSSSKVVVDGHYYWYLMYFINADFFSGVSNEFLNAGEGMARLFCSLAEVPKNLIVDHHVLPPAQDSLDIAELAENCKKEWPLLFGEPSYLLVESWGYIKDTLEETIQLESKITDSMGLCHIDLHPHNLLMQESKVSAILDFGSLVQAPIYSSIAFNLFKLARQTIALKNGDYLNADFINQKNIVVSSFLTKNLIPENADLGKYAKVEIMRRLLLILKLNIENNNSDWNHVLPIQINALKEAEMIFS
jgi:serine/threonine protein kinase